MMKNSGTKPSPTQKREDRTRFESSHEEEKKQEKENSKLLQKTVEVKEQWGKSRVFSSSSEC